MLQSLQSGLSAPDRISLGVADPALLADLPRLLRALDTLPGGPDPLTHIEVGRHADEIRIDLYWTDRARSYNFNPRTGLAAPLPNS